MKRWHEEVHITLRNWKLHRRIHVESNIDHSESGKDPFVVDCSCDNQLGRFRKMDAFDCGIPGCLGCHGDKFPVRTPTRQERQADLILLEGLEELENHEDYL